MKPTGVAPLSEVLPFWPEAFGEPTALERVGIRDFEVTGSGGGLALKGKLIWAQEIEVPLPLLRGVSIILLSGNGFTEVPFELALLPELVLVVPSIEMGLRFRTDLLRRVELKGKTWTPVLNADGSPRPAELVFGGLGFRAQLDGDVGFTGSPKGNLPPVAIGDTGVVLELNGLTPYLSARQTLPANVPAGFRGVTIDAIKVFLPKDIDVPLAPSSIQAQDLRIGTGGFSGKLAGSWTPSFNVGQNRYQGNGSGSLFGMSFALRSLTFEFLQNVPVESELKGELVLPFFDKRVGVDLSVGFDGAVSVALSAAQIPPASVTAGLLTLEREGVFRLQVDSIGFDIEGGVFTAKVSGKLTPLLGADKGLKWPSFDVKELSIDSEGHVHLDGGWLSLPKQQTLDFYGFKIEITQLGFGNTDDGGKWIGFSGGLKLVDGLQAGAAVEGLRITWYEDGRDPRVTLNGAGVELKIPDVLELKGAVSFRELDGELPGEKIQRFDGDIHLKLETPNLEIDGTLVIGSVKGPQGRYNFFAIYVDVELPTGIPLASTGLAIYGLAGLFALQMEPNKKPSELWFGIDHSKSFYHRGKPGITDLKSKWDPRQGSFAIGAGITLGTLADNGYTFNGKFLLAIVIPGPIVLIQGAASFLTKRADGGSEGQFRALTVIDGRAGNLTIGIDAEYQTGSGGELLRIGGSVEAFYAFHDPTAWHLWLGQREPRELRIRALFGRFVEANAYFMLDAHALALGAWFGYANGWTFGPLSVRLEAWAEGNAKLSFKPTQFEGDLWLHCLLELSVFGFGLGIAIDAKIAAELFKPYHLRGEFSVGIKLPWPFHKKKLGGTVVLEWGPRPIAPPLPLPVVNVGIEHLKSAVASWPLPRGRFLEPNWDDGAGFLAGPAPVPIPAATAVPRVPLDSRIAVTFARSVHDAALVGSPPCQIDPEYEAIGDPSARNVLEVKYVLRAVTLERWDGAWKTVASSPKSGSTPTLFGTWKPVPQLPDTAPPGTPPKPGQTKLLLWSKTPFDFVRHTGSSWEEWVSDAMPDYPCIPVRPTEETCFGFGALAPGAQIVSPWTYPGPPSVTLSWGFGLATVVARTVAGAGVTRTVNVLCFPDRAAQSGVSVTPQEPGKKFRLVLASGAGGPQQSASAVSPAAVAAPRVARIDVTPTCVDFRQRTAGTVPNPWSAQDEVRVTVREAGGGLAKLGRVERWGEGPLGLNAGYQLDVDVACPSSWVEILVTHRPPFRIVAFDATGAAVATYAPGGSGGEVTETIRLEGKGITHLTVYAAGNEKLVHRICFLCTRPSGPSANAFDGDHLPLGPFYPNPIDGVITVDGHGIPDVVLTSDGPLCLEQICVTPDPEADQEVGRDEAIQHIRDELARWKSDGAVLAPDTFYRLTVQTELVLRPTEPDLSGVPAVGSRSPVERAYFHTARPPGLEVLKPPEGVPEANFDSGLDDLVRYVKETDPPTVPPPGEKPILFKPFYRAYDVGVEFNEDYVEQMYRSDRRDLGLYLYDNNNQLARDEKGRVLALVPRWDRAEELTLSERETRWLTLIDAATCIPVKPDPKTFPRDATLVSTEARVLAPDRLHEARLAPLLLHESFTAGVVGAAPPGWYADDFGAGGPSAWKLGEVGAPPSRFVEQTSAIGSAGEPARPGTVLLLADLAAQAPAQDWTDYRLSVYVRSAAGGMVGVVFRHSDAGTWYRFALHESGRRLVKAGPGGLVILAEDHVSYPRNRDYLLTVEAIGESLRTYVDGEPVFAVEDGDLVAGRIGLYACQSPGARFTDVRVDDFRPAAPVVYRFQLTTSLYANFFHHLHSYQDETWPFDLGSEPVPAEAALLTFNPPSEEEARAYETLADKVLGQAARQNPPRVEVTRLNRTGQAPAFLLRIPEPLDWKRVELEVSGTGRHLSAPAVPGDLKLTDISFGAAKPEEETVTVLLREAIELTRHRLELWDLPSPVRLPEGDPVLLLESFRREAALERFTIVNVGDVGGPSQWLVEGGALLQISEIRGGSQPELPGTLAVTGDADWTDYRLTVDLRSDLAGALGVVFRYRDENHYYRFSLDARLRYRRLVKVEGGQVTILWEEQSGFTLGEPFQLIVEAVGPRLTSLLDGLRIFEVIDSAHAQGRVGLYASNNPGARCEHFEVRQPSLEAHAWLRDRFAEGSLTGWLLVSEVPLPQAPTWEASGGALRLRSLSTQGGSPAYPGVYAVAGDPGWTDVIVSVRLRSPAGAGGALGLLFRGANLQSYYRFSISRQPAYRQLVKKVGGQTTVLWRDDVAYPADRSLELTVVAVGSSLRGYLDGVLLFAVEDGDVPAGRIGLYAWNNSEAWFSSVRVWPAERAFGAWLLDETFGTPALDGWNLVDDPASWQVEAGELRHDPVLPWSELDGGLDGTVHVIASAGREIFFGGDFQAAGEMPASRIAAWDGSAWSALGSGVNGAVHAIAVQDDQVYVGGQFTQAGGGPARNLAVWNRAKQTWSAIGNGVGGPVFALAVAEGRLYVGGQFNRAGTMAAGNVAARDLATRSWSNLGGGVNNIVLAMAARGKHVYVGGRFTQAGGKPASKVARWDGNAWVASSGTINGPVTALALGEIDLYIGGGFTQVGGGVAANRIARWTGAGWSALGAGLDGQVDAIVVAGNQVWVGGQFTQAGGAPASRIARWSRSAGTWSAAGAGMDGVVRTIAIDEEVVHVGGAFASPAQRIARMPRGGTGSALAGQDTGEAFRLAARLRPGADGAVAVLFRWQDEENHDALWLDAELGIRRLIQTRGGMAKALWEDAVRPVAGREHAVTIDVLGGRLTGYLDGVELFSLLDGMPSTGRAGFASRRSPEARFAELKIATPSWTLYHAFGEEELLQAGTRVLVRAGGEVHASTEPGLVHRSAALIGEQGSLRLRRGGAALRIIGADGRSGHSRSFLPENEYSPVAVLALRKADGTGLFLFPTGDEAAASYRLRWIYHRDRKDAGRPFSQAGSRAPERATLDLF